MSGSSHIIMLLAKADDVVSRPSSMVALPNSVLHPAFTEMPSSVKVRVMGVSVARGR
jgi:hypothetical protein